MMARVLLATVVVLALAACARADSAAVQRGGHDSRHPTIVSLNPCSDAVLTQVADKGQILALSHYSMDPRSSSMDVAQARRFASTGGTAEEVMALQPDVVIAGSFLPPATRAAFERLGMRVEVLGLARTVKDSVAQVRDVARIAGYPDRGEKLVGRIEQALDRAAPPPAARPVDAVMWQSGGIVPGANVLVSDLLRHTGFASHSVRRGLGQADVLPLEQVLADPPQVIFAAGTPGDGENRMLRHPALEALAGTRHAAFAPGLLYCGGPSLIRAVDRLSDVRRSVIP